MRRSLTAGLICLLGLLAAIPPARAMQFEAVQATQTDAIIGGRGPIVKGDTARLQQAFASIPQTLKFLVLELDSPGGSVAEGVDLMNYIRANRIPVLIPSNAKCASACFLLFAAAPRRIAAPDALIGVHSASIDGKETGDTLAITTQMARWAGELGVPPAILGKMVQAKPRGMEWLTADDLASMDVRILDPDPAPKQTETNTASNRPAPPVARPVAPPSPTPVAGFGAGRDDRHAWEGWLVNVAGARRDGAIFAFGQFNMPQPGSCYTPDGVSRGDFTQGCEAARQRLTPVAMRIRDNADYAKGWNSGGPIGSVSPAVQTQAPAAVPVEAEYQGVYFCGRQVASLKLQFYRDATARHRALLSFGPQATSPNIPRGSYYVEGSFDMLGGEVLLAPVQWVSQPPGYEWIGLNGRSDDGGKTYSGRVSNSRECTIFTLKRVGGSVAR